MVIGAFPAAKLGALLLKQVSKPIASVVKNQAKSSPVFRKYVCMPPAQYPRKRKTKPKKALGVITRLVYQIVYNWCEIKAKMWILNLGKPVNIPVLNEAQAIELGANLLGEAIIFIIAAGILINEYARSSAKDAAKEAARKQELDDLHNDIKELFIQAEEERAQIRELLRKVGDQHSQLAMLSSKLGIQSKKPGNDKQPEEPIVVPPYSPVNDDPNLSDIPQGAPEVYQLKAELESGTSILLLKSVDDIVREFLSFSSKPREDSYVRQALFYLSQVFRLQS